MTIHLTARASTGYNYSGYKVYTAIQAQGDTLEDYKEEEPQSLNKVVAILTAVHSGQDEIAQELFNEIDKQDLYSILVNLLLSSYTIISRATGVPVEDYLQRLGFLSAIF